MLLLLYRLKAFPTSQLPRLRDLLLAASGPPSIEGPWDLGENLTVSLLLPAPRGW